MEMHGNISEFLPFDHQCNIQNLFDLDAIEEYSKILQNGFLNPWSFICILFSKSFLLSP